MKKIKHLHKKVVVAMSGGIDSSVAAALLKEAGFDVIGFFMKLWLGSSKNRSQDYWNRCCSAEAEIRARKVAKILKVPFYVLNFEKEFKKRIVNCFLKEHKAGRTPNPCVMCNKEIKFGLLLEKALRVNADYVATGHYARKKKIIDKRKGTKYKLLQGKDKEKDQSYFLWMLNQKQLNKILFPNGNYTKGEIRRLAKKFKLPVLKVPESMEICFIPNTLEDFLKRHLKLKPGKIVDSEKGLVGRHQGLYLYTIGQRKGIKLPGGPFYVLDKNQKKNLLIVTKDRKNLYKKELVAKKVNWISGKEPSLSLKVKAKIRYRHKSALATITKKLKDRAYKIEFEKPQRAVTGGQSIVFYKGQEVLGGGIICD